MAQSSDFEAATSGEFPISGRRSLADYPVLLYGIAAFGLLLFCLSRLPAIEPALDLSLSNGDDSMRLLQVRDFLAGQGWFDTSQYRYLPPDGGIMHFSRLLDAPLALAISGLTPFLGARMAEGSVAAAWPIGLFLVYVAVVFAGLRRIAGLQAACLAVPVAGQVMLFGDLFGPGRIDHHNVQIVLNTGAAFAFALSSRSLRAPLWGGALVALSLAIGLEALPFAVAIGMLYAIAWVVEGNTAGRAFRGFAGALGAVSAAAFVGQTAPSRLLLPACDSLSPPWLVLTGGATLIAFAVTAMPGLRSAGARLLAVGLSGALLVAAFALAYPACLAGPYGAVPEPFRSAWLDAIPEAFSVAEMLAVAPETVFLFLGPVVAAALAAIAASLRTKGDTRRLMIACAAIACTGALLSLVQVRTLFLASAVIAVVAGFVLDRLVNRFAAARPAVPTVALALASLLFFEPPWFAVALGIGRPAPTNHHRTDRVAAPDSCGFDDVRALSALPAGNVLAHIDLGPPILLHTQHSVIAGGFHRAPESIVAGIEAFSGSQMRLRDVVRRDRADYLVVCPGWLASSESRPEPFVMSLVGGTEVDWLEPLPDRGALKVWRVRSISDR